MSDQANRQKNRISESSRRLDRKTKRALNERFDVSEYWLADPELGIFEIYRRA